MQVIVYIINGNSRRIDSGQIICLSAIMDGELEGTVRHISVGETRMLQSPSVEEACGG